MIIVYTPATQEHDGPAKLGALPHDLGERRFTFKPNKLMSVEAEAIEDATDWTFTEFGEKFLKGSMKAKRAALWVLLKREFPALKFRDLSFSPEEIEVDFDEDEAAAIREALADDPDVDEEQRAAVLAIIGDGETPKDPTPTTGD